MAASTFQSLVDDFVENENHNASTDIQNGIHTSAFFYIARSLCCQDGCSVGSVSSAVWQFIHQLVHLSPGLHR